jgi:hypothetical protein
LTLPDGGPGIGFQFRIHTKQVPCLASAALSGHFRDFQT